MFMNSPHPLRRNSVKHYQAPNSINTFYKILYFMAVGNPSLPAGQDQKAYQLYKQIISSAETPQDLLKQLNEIKWGNYKNSSDYVFSQLSLKQLYRVQRFISDIRASSSMQAQLQGIDQLLIKTQQYVTIRLNQKRKSLANLSFILATPDALDILKQKMKNTGSFEFLQFYLRLQKYKSITNESDRVNQAKRIMSKYFEIRLSSYKKELKHPNKRTAIHRENNPSGWLIIASGKSYEFTITEPTIYQYDENESDNVRRPLNLFVDEILIPIANSILNGTATQDLFNQIEKLTILEIENSDAFLQLVKTPEFQRIINNKLGIPNLHISIPSPNYVEHVESERRAGFIGFFAKRQGSPISYSSNDSASSSISSYSPKGF